MLHTLYICFSPFGLTNLVGGLFPARKLTSLHRTPSMPARGKSVNPTEAELDALGTDTEHRTAGWCVIATDTERARVSASVATLSL